MLRRISTIFALALLASSVLPAQTPGYSPPAVNVPWNNYVPSRIPNAYSTIIGLPGTTLISGSDQGGYTNYALALPFSFRFIDQTYAAGYSMRVATSGFIGMNGATSTSTTSYGYLFYQTGTTIAYYNKIIAPYWTDVYPSGLSDGGIFWRVDGTAPNRVMTIEWRVRGVSYPSSTVPGNFQCKLYEGTSNIEFYYGPNSLDREPPSINPQRIGYGAWVGIKNMGQNSTGLPSGNDAEKFLWMLHPDQVIQSGSGLYSPGRDTVAITRARTGLYGGSTQYYMEGYAYYAAYLWLDGDNAYTYYKPSPYFHYGFPTEYGQRIGYRLSPVLNDVATDSVWFTPTRVANAYGIGSTVTVNARFKNIGGNPRQNVPVKYDVYRNGTQLVASGTGTAFPTSTPQFSTSDMTFATTVGQPVTNVTGQYQVRVYPQLTNPTVDQDFKNDTLYTNFYISKSNDLMTYSILQPFSNVAPLYNKYPVGVGVPIEVRYLNIGTNPQTNARVGYIIYDANGSVVATNTAVVTGTWSAIQFRDINFSPWTPSAPGRYYVRAFTMLNGDEDATNDTLPKAPALGKPFDVLYEIEVSAGNPQLQPHSPQMNGFYPDGKPIRVSATFFNSGVSDATNIPATVQITYNGTPVYNRTATILNIIGDGGIIEQQFPDFIPNGSGQYCVTAFSNYSQEPVRSNDTIRWCFNVKPRLAGLIRVGFGERFRTIQEARDSLFRYGVGGPLTFELVDDSYTVAQTEATTPALDFRGRVVGLNASNPVIWRPIAGKTSVTVNLKTGSGIGMWYGQRDTSNPSGYITWDGGAGKVLHFTYENTGTKNAALPVFFGTGSSNYAMKNLSIEPITNGGRKTATTLSMPSYNSTFNQFSFTPDLGIQTSAGVMFRNTPAELLPGATIRPDSLRNQNNVIDNVTIRNFAYGIASVGAGPLWEVANNRYGEYLNTNNTFSNNVIEDVSRGGIVVAFEKNSKIIGNTIRRVENTSTTVASAAGIAATAGGNTANNRGYSSDLTIEKNKISTVTAKVGSAAAISVETNENVFVSPTTQIFRFPTNGATNMQVVNNMAWDYSGAQATAGVALMIESMTRRDFMTSGNRIESNTLYNEIAGATAENGVYLQRAGGSVKNNIIALDSRDAANGHTMVALAIEIGNYQQTIQSDYNLFWVPQGSVGMITNLSSEGYVLPSKPVATTLQQWQALTGLDMNSVYGDVTGEFVSTTPGAVDLHINANLLGSLASDRGTAVSGVTSDIDGDPRNQTTRPDIGADEYAGKVRNYDLTATNVVAPFGYRATSGQYSDAEYLMVPAGPIGVSGEVRNIGGQPFLQNVVTLTIERKVGSGWAMMASNQVTTAVDAGAAKTLSFGTFTPQTLGQLGQSDAFYGTNPNVTPVYRFTVTTGTDDNAANNGYSKEIRFYVQRSNRQTLVSVENFQTSLPSTPAGLSNKLNTDSVLSALNQIAWDRADGVGADDYDLFERDKWPSQSLNFVPWRTVIWSQGEEAQGLQPEERAALKAQMTSGDLYFRKNLIIAGQEVARIHDVALTSSNGAVADRDFVRNYLRAEYRGTTTPSNYDGRRIQGVRITPGKYEVVKATGMVNDPAPMPSTLRLTTGEGIAAATHSYVEQTVTTTDTVAGVAATGSLYNSIYYAIDWRHAGRFSFEASQSGVRRMLLGALDYVDQFRGVLPVDLVDFSAEQVGRRAAVSVNWKTASEVDVAAMEVERAEVVRSETGEVVGAYTVVDHVGSRGSATSGATYRTTDEGVELGSEYRYRIVTVNIDGSRDVSDAREVKVLSSSAASGMSLTALPNPMRESGSVAYEVPAGEHVRVVLYDGAGRTVSVLSESVEGSGRVAIPVSELNSGVYTVRLEGASGVAMSEKVTVQK